MTAVSPLNREMDSRASLVILTSGVAEGQEIVKGILETEDLDCGSAEGEGVEVWPWEVDNKYYTASVQLAVVASVPDALPWIRANGEALVVYCQAAQTNVLESLNGIVEKLEDFEPEVQLLVCDACSPEDTDTRLSRLTAQQWCISNGWELVELDPHSSELDCSDEEDDFPESFGFKRIRQALHAHTWSNLNMKDNHGSRLGAVLKSVTEGDNSGDECHSGDGGGETEVVYSRLADLTLTDHQTSTPNTNGVDDQELDETGLDATGLGNDLGSFEGLFSNFAQLKRTAAGLPPDQRRDYAEKVAVAFWRAMGGDEDEVTGLDSEAEF